MRHRARQSLRHLVCLVLLPAALGAVSVATDPSSPPDVVRDGVVQSAWTHPGKDPSATDFHSYLTFYVAAADETVSLSSRAVGARILLPVLYGNAPETGESPSSQLNFTLSTQPQKFYIELDCFSQGSTTVEVSAVLSDQTALKWYLQKRCGGGRRRDITARIGGFVATSGGRELARWTKPLVSFNNSVNVSLAIAQGNQRIKEITVESEVPTEIRRLESSFVSKECSFWVVPLCSSAQASEAAVRVAIPPFSDLVFHWVFDCRGVTSSGLQVGTSRQTSDIIRSGETQWPFDVGAEVNSSTYSAQFFVREQSPATPQLATDL